MGRTDLVDTPDFRIREGVEGILNGGTGELGIMLRESVDGMISIATAIKRLWVVGGTVPKKIDIDIIKAVGKVLSESPKLKVSKDGLRVGLVEPLPPIYEPKADSSLVAYPFDDDVSVSQVAEFFEKLSNNQVDCTKILKGVDGEQFNKAALITFREKEVASMILGMEVKFEEGVLEMKSKIDFDALMDRQEVNPKKKVTFKLELSKLPEVPEDDVSCNDVLIIFQDFGSIKNSSFDPILKSGWVLFREEGPAQLAVEAIEDDDVLRVKNYIIRLESQASLKRNMVDMSEEEERMTKVPRTG